MNPEHGFRYLAVFLLLTAAFSGVAAAENEDNAESGDTIVNIDLDSVVDAIEELIEKIENWDATLTDVLKIVFFSPFQLLGQQLLEILAKVLTTTPDVHPNPAVEDVHRDTLVVTYLLSTTGFMAAGVLYMTGPILGISYAEVRKIIPRIIAALIFASVSLPLLQLAVDLTNALSAAFTPNQLYLSTQEIIGLTTGLAIVWVVKAVALLAVVVLFLMRDVYIMFVAAISPLLALMWSLPRVRRYADTFIAGWFAALLIAPLDILVLKFALAMLKGQGTGALQSISNWVIGIASLVLLLIVPYQVWTASQTIVGQAHHITHEIRNRRNNTNNPDPGLEQPDGSQQFQNRRSPRGSFKQFGGEK